jgi:isoquinoline 1-oxidoreductase subunit alpha
MRLTITVNGTEQIVDADADTPLLWVLRNHLRLVGTKFGCGMALCGACTVHLDGQPVRSCVTPLSAVGSKRVTTIEGVDGPVAEAVIDAWVAEDVPQCGYCQSGQVMSACALLAADRSPDDAAIDRAMDGNLCRCGAYPRIRKAIRRAVEVLADESRR